MPAISDIAICIRHWDFSETSQTVSLFSREHGIIRGLAKGAKREKGRFSGGIDLFARGEAGALIKPGSDLATITEWTLLDVHWFLRENLAAHRRALYFADLIHHMVRDHDPHPALYDAFERALAGLADAAHLDASTVEFLWMLLVETGYRPQVHVDARTGRPLDPSAPLAFDAAAGGVVADDRGLARWRLRPDTLAILQRLAAACDRQDLADPCNSRELNAPAAGRAARLLSAYIREILGFESPMLRWVFPALARR